MSGKKPTHKCPKCERIVEITFDYLNFKCVCGYRTHLLMRRELMDLNDPVERELALQIFVGSLLK